MRLVARVARVAAVVALMVSANGCGVLTSSHFADDDVLGAYSRTTSHWVFHGDGTVEVDQVPGWLLDVPDPSAVDVVAPTKATWQLVERGSEQLVMVTVHVAPEHGYWELFGFHLVVADGKAVGLRLTQVGPHHNQEWTISKASA